MNASVATAFSDADKFCNTPTNRYNNLKTHVWLGLAWRKDRLAKSNVVKLTGATITTKPKYTSVAASEMAMTPKTIVTHRSVNLDTHMLRGETYFGVTSMASTLHDCLEENGREETSRFSRRETRRRGGDHAVFYYAYLTGIE